MSSEMNKADPAEQWLSSLMDQVVRMRARARYIP